MLDSIEQLKQAPLSPEERKDGISKYSWSIYKSIINMVPIYEKPIGKGDYLWNPRHKVGIPSGILLKHSFLR